MLTYMYYCEVGVPRMQDRLEKITVTTGLTTPWMGDAWLIKPCVPDTWNHFRLRYPVQNGVEFPILQRGHPDGKAVHVRCDSFARTVFLMNL
jgi:hypothetical protein